MLRQLGGFETVLWLLDQTRSIHFVTAAEIAGHIPVSQWEKGLESLQRRHPLLSVCIREKGPLQPAFYRVEGRPIPLRVVQDEAESRLDRELEAEMDQTFDYSVAPLMRAVLIEGKDRSTIILTIHHSIGDGISALYLVRDLLQAISGQPLSSLPLPPTHESLLGIYSTAAAASTKNAAIPPTTAATTPSRPPSSNDYRVPQALPRIQHTQLSPAETTSLIERCRKEGTTVHGALCAAFVLAGRQALTDWHARPIRVQSLISSRKALDIKDDLCVYFATHMLTVDSHPLTDFWELARQTKHNLAASETKEAIRENARLLQGVADAEAGVLATDQIRLEGFANEIQLSNLGIAPYGSTFGALQVRSVWGGMSFSGGDDQYVAGIVTANGSLSILLGARKPLGDFLTVASQILKTASQPEKALL
jgi:NRPS condensation-like uncharacterized protein